MEYYDPKPGEFVNGVLVSGSENKLDVCFVFRRELFKGGLTGTDIALMRADKQKEKEAKEKQDKEYGNELMDGDSAEEETRCARIANVVAGQVRKELMVSEKRIIGAIDGKVESALRRFSFEKKIRDIESAVSMFKEIEERVNSNVSDAVEGMQDNVIRAIHDFLRNPIASYPTGPSDVGNGSPRVSTSDDSKSDDMSSPPHNSVGDKSNDGGARGMSAETDAPIPKGMHTSSPSEAHNPENVTSLTDVGSPAPVVHTQTEQEPVGQEQQNLDFPPCASSPNCPNEAVRKVLEDLNADMDVSKNAKLAALRPGSGAHEAGTSSINEGEDKVEDPSFSLGVMQDRTSAAVVEALSVGYVLPTDNARADANEARKRKRARGPASGYEDFQCDLKIGVSYTIIPDIDRCFEGLAEELNPLKFIVIGGSHTISTREFLDIAHRKHQMIPKVMDVLMGYIGSQLGLSAPALAVFDSTLPPSIMKSYSRFVKAAVKDSHKVKFGEEVLG
ncbi:hypothetical protein Bca52824_027216 [Brassica carinata]|uniref:Uncharacterized protein n=1 Tax=Brassica carinata TaxID=52824 RepID=A0A8X7SJF5_BRACI|nr:hypothetical protein Bca52824_027216 [Brassica carinata]